ncbi:MAG: ATP-binding protein [Gemmatimonadales bacterium]
MTAASTYPQRPGSDPPGEHKPPVPETVRDTGLSSEFITDLLLKTMYSQGSRTGQQLMDAVRLPFQFVDDRLLDLQQRRFVEVRGTSGHSRGGYIFDLTGAGRERAREAFAMNQYVGAAPVPLEQYRNWTNRQSIASAHVTREVVREGFRALVLEDAMLEMLGPAINSAKSLFLYGSPGNGKTFISETIAGLLGGAFYIPYAVEVEGQILNLFDPIYHHPVPEPASSGATGPATRLIKPIEDYDRRFVRVARPVVMIGGELTLDQLDLQYDSFTKMYQAPFQMKSNGGVLILDDFGRQRVPPRDLLNRWIVPLEKRIDFLTLHTGGKFPVPFDTLLIFATNLAPTELVEEAFLRRIHYKIHVPGPDPEEYLEIFKRCCASRGIPFEEHAVQYIYSRYYKRLGIQPRACHPRDILDHVQDIARFLEVEHRLTNELLDRACQSYFLDDISTAR